jgi:hypothetical protein
MAFSVLNRWPAPQVLKLKLRHHSQFMAACHVCSSQGSTHMHDFDYGMQQPPLNTGNP